MPVYLLSDALRFPSPLMAAENGLLAVGGDLSQERLLLAYRMGIFPWFDQGEPIMWWSPDPRLVLYPKELHISRRLRRTIQKEVFRITFDTAFDEVITACAQVRHEKEEGTWIGPEMIAAYSRLHTDGFAHSFEAWHEGKLAGGLYGVSLGKCFFGESMFSRASNASKVALAALADYLHARSFNLIDCQVPSAHLIRLGARLIPRIQFLRELQEALKAPTRTEKWGPHTTGMLLF